MQTLPNEIISEVLDFSGDIAIVARLVSKRWHKVVDQNAEVLVAKKLVRRIFGSGWHKDIHAKKGTWSDLLNTLCFIASMHIELGLECNMKRSRDSPDFTLFCGRPDELNYEDYDVIVSEEGEEIFLKNGTWQPIAEICEKEDLDHYKWSTMVAHSAMTYWPGRGTFDPCETCAFLPTPVSDHIFIHLPSVHFVIVEDMTKITTSQGENVVHMRAAKDAIFVKVVNELNMPAFLIK